MGKPAFDHLRSGFGQGTKQNLPLRLAKTQPGGHSGRRSSFSPRGLRTLPEPKSPQPFRYEPYPKHYGLRRAALGGVLAKDELDLQLFRKAPRFSKNSPAGPSKKGQIRIPSLPQGLFDPSTPLECWGFGIDGDSRRSPGHSPRWSDLCIRGIFPVASHLLVARWKPPRQSGGTRRRFLNVLSRILAGQTTRTCC